MFAKRGSRWLPALHPTLKSSCVQGPALNPEGSRQVCGRLFDSRYTRSHLFVHIISCTAFGPRGRRSLDRHLDGSVFPPQLDVEVQKCPAKISAGPRRARAAAIQSLRSLLSPPAAWFLPVVLGAVVAPCPLSELLHTVHQFPGGEQRLPNTVTESHKTGA